MGARENECQISQNYILHMKFSEFYLCNHNSCEIWHSFSRTSLRDFLWCYYRWFITSLAPEKVRKKAIFFKLFWYEVFVQWKLKLLNFLVDSVLTLFYCYFPFKVIGDELAKFNCSQLLPQSSSLPYSLSFWFNLPDTLYTNWWRTKWLKKTYTKTTGVS